jgi:hypothetical protein
MEIRTLAGELVRIMEEKLAQDAVSVPQETQLRWLQAIEQAKANADVSQIKAMLDAWSLQEGREQGMFHLSSQSAKAVWDRAMAEGRALAGTSTKAGQACKEAREWRRNARETALGSFKRRALSLHQKFSLLPPDATHAQVLTSAARAEGFAHYQALESKLKRNGAQFCVLCGALGTLKVSGKVHACGQCNGSFELDKLV